jgi:hypothetical protein
MENGQGPKTKTNKRSAAKVAEILERGTKILDLRKNGASLRAISKILTKEAEEKGLSTRGFSYGQVRKDFNEIVELRVEEQQDIVAEDPELAAERLEEVTRHLMPLLQMPLIDPPTQLGSPTSSSTRRSEPRPQSSKRQASMPIFTAQNGRRRSSTAERSGSTGRR